jgi:hypothetical protein
VSNATLLSHRHPPVDLDRLASQNFKNAIVIDAVENHFEEYEVIRKAPVNGMTGPRRGEENENGEDRGREAAALEAGKELVEVS